MANATVTVLEADGETETDVEVLGFGRQAAAASKSTAMSTEDKAVLDSLGTKLDTLATKIDALDASVDAVTAAVGNGTVDTGTASTPATDFVSVHEEAGVIMVAGVACTPKYAAIAASTSGNNTIVTAVTSKKIRVLAVHLVASGTVNAKWQSGAGGTDISGLAYLVSNAGYVLPFNSAGWFETGSNTLLNLNLSAPTPVGGGITYIEV